MHSLQDLSQRQLHCWRHLNCQPLANQFIRNMWLTASVRDSSMEEKCTFAHGMQYFRADEDDLIVWECGQKHTEK